MVSNCAIFLKKLFFPKLINENLLWWVFNSSLQANEQNSLLLLNDTKFLCKYMMECVSNFTVET